MKFFPVIITSWINQTLFVIHFEHRKRALQQEQQSTDQQTQSFHS